ncbi:MAG: nitroreductase family protein [Chloroflexota bacterium]
MDAMEAILSRRSIRKYAKQPVAQQDIDDLLKAAMAAPSANNQQPWHFVVIDDHRILDEIPKFHPYSQMLKDAAVAILVCGDVNLDRGGGMWVQDCAAATENILIAARALGLGAVWLGIFPREERYITIREMLGMPDHVVPFSLVSLGYPAEQKAPSARFNQARIHRNGW